MNDNGTNNSLEAIRSTMDVLRLQNHAENHVAVSDTSLFLMKRNAIIQNVSPRKSMDNIPYLDDICQTFSEQYCRSLGDTRQGVGTRQQYKRGNEIFENIFYHVYHEDHQESRDECLEANASCLVSLSSYKCYPCSLSSVKADSKGFCVECRMYLCIECLKKHGRTESKHTKPIPKPRKTIPKHQYELPIRPSEKNIHIDNLMYAIDNNEIGKCESCELPRENNGDICHTEVKISGQSTMTSSESDYAYSSVFSAVPLISRDRCVSEKKEPMKTFQPHCTVKIKVDVISFLPKDKVITGMSMLFEGSVIMTDNKNKSLLRISPKRNVHNSVTVSSEPYDVSAVGFNEVAFTLPSESRVQFANVDIDSIHLGKKINVRDRCYGITAWKDLIAVSCKKSRKVKLLNRCGECYAEVKSTAEYAFCPDKIIIDQADGHLYVTDTIENRILIFTIGNHKIEFVRSSMKYFQYGNPSSIAMSSLGNLYACYSYRRCVCRFPRNMNSVEELPEIDDTPDILCVGGIDSDLLSVLSKDGYLTVYDTNTT